MRPKPMLEIDWADICREYGERTTYLRKLVSKKELNIIADSAWEINKVIRQINKLVEKKYEKT